MSGGDQLPAGRVKSQRNVEPLNQTPLIPAARCLCWVAGFQRGKALVGSEARAEDGQGNLLFLRNNTLMAQPLDLQRLETAGSAFPVAEDIAFGVTSNRALFRSRGRVGMPNRRSAR